ncbi:virulence RhuM family protein [Chryseobacterium sp. WG14]|uniref:virulence RhuM family protein n=1 Tax=unclassified Chryseobacterium TaxID=2593645 RepID=UPI00211EC464|nr:MULTISPECIES: virulence RhuM family protein [unclassified Chryseobacterium]MCQ9636878.1 virulence RhuM family protein [Chryseobacterium sp. WG23]MCQ9639906.1 virulence RhuM family protein [Chryseobacterium sp. WG14]
MDNQENYSKFIFYQSEEGKTNIQVIVDDNNETIWVTQKSMSEIFDIDISGITKHLQNIFEDGELIESSNVQKMHIATSTKPVNFYNLDVIISVGYRVNSYKATQFRKWATSVLKEYMIKGFALDDERLKQGNKMFGKDYFAELLERIREIRSSERLFYQKITDIYATSIDYDPHSPITQEFYATVQNKLHWAIHNHTAAELIKLRADYKSQNMGLTSWKNEKKGGKILKTDVTVAKNYLNQDEIRNLNRVVTMYLDFAENMADRNREMKMLDWIVKLDAFLSFNEYDILKDSGKVSKSIAKKIAENEYEKFRVIQDVEYKSDFDKVVAEIKVSGKIPPRSEFSISGFLKQAEQESNLSDFDQKLKKGLGFDPKSEK